MSSSFRIDDILVAKGGSSSGGGDKEKGAEEDSMAPTAADFAPPQPAQRTHVW